MTKIELEQFLIDPQPKDSTILVDANWLQQKLKLKYKTELQLHATLNIIEALEEKIGALEDKLDIYKSMAEAYRKMRILNTYC